MPWLRPPHTRNQEDMPHIGHILLIVFSGFHGRHDHGRHQPMLFHEHLLGLHHAIAIGAAHDVDTLGE